jgi:hypothetical protein
LKSTKLGLGVFAPSPFFFPVRQDESAPQAFTRLHIVPCTGDCLEELQKESDEKQQKGKTAERLYPEDAFNEGGSHPPEGDRAGRCCGFR